MFISGFRSGMVRNADTGGGGASPGSSGAAPGGDGKPADPAPGAPSAAAAAAYHPQGLAENFRGASDRETIDRLVQHVSAIPRAPDKPESYALKIDEKLSAYVPKDDPGVAVWRNVAHKLGLSDEQASGAINGIYASLIEQGAIAKPMTDADFNKALADLATIQGGADQDRLRSGAERFHAVRDDLQGLVTAKVIDDAGFQKLFGLMDRDVTALPVIEALIRKIPVAGGPRGSGTGRGDPAASDDAEQAVLNRMYPTMVKA